MNTITVHTMKEVSADYTGIVFLPGGVVGIQKSKFLFEENSEYLLLWIPYSKFFVGGKFPFKSFVFLDTKPEIINEKRFIPTLTEDGIVKIPEIYLRYKGLLPTP
jgi:hypothetical protein